MMLDLKQADLARKAHISIATLNNIERGAQTDPKISTLRAIQDALEAEGIEFMQDPLGGVGLRLRPRVDAHAPATILIVDDSRADRTLYRSWLSDAPGPRSYQVVEAADAREGFDAFVKHHPGCIILDFKMYGTDGFQLLADFQRAHAPLPPIIFVTGMHNATLEAAARAKGVHAYLNKQTMRKEELHEAVTSAIKTRRVAV